MANSGQKQQSSVGVQVQTVERTPRNYHVVFLNDDTTTMQFVVEVLRTIFNHTAGKAWTLMLRVHKQGRAIVGTYSYDIAMTKCAQAMAAARKQGYPLRVITEPAE